MIYGLDIDNENKVQTTMITQQKYYQ